MLKNLVKSLLALAMVVQILASPLAVSANTEPTHFVTTVNAAAGGGEFTAGSTVPLTSLTFAGERFVRWEEINRPSGAERITFSPNATTMNASFTMPARDVTIRAVFEPVATPSQTITSMRRTGVTRQSATFRAGPSSAYRNIGEVSGNTNLRITGRSGDFYRVVVNGQTGWLRQTTVARTRQMAVVTNDRAHVRESRSSSSRSLTRVRSGDRLTLERQTGSWSRVTVNGHRGWIRNRDLAIENASRPGQVVTSVAAVHSRPRAASSVRHVLPRGAQLMIVQRTSDGWTQIAIRHNAGTLNGWVRTNQIERSNHNRLIVGSAALRSGPSSSYSRITTLSHGSRISVRARAGSRYYIRETVNGRNVHGWVRRDEVTRLALPR